MKPKYIESKEGNFRIKDKIAYINLKGIKKEAEIVDFEMVKEWVARLSDGELVHPDYLTLIA